jgi:hypothetical protein
MILGKRRQKFPYAELFHRECRIDQDIAVGWQSAEHTDLMEQRGVLHDHGVGMGHCFAGADRLFIDATKGHDRCPHPLRPEAGESLGMLAVCKGGHRQQLRRRHHSLSAPTVNANLNHIFNSHHGNARTPAVHRPSLQSRHFDLARALEAPIEPTTGYRTEHFASPSQATPISMPPMVVPARLYESPSQARHPISSGLQDR